MKSKGFDFMFCEIRKDVAILQLLSDFCFMAQGHVGATNKTVSTC